MKRALILLAIVLCTTAWAQNKHNASTPKDPATIPLPPDKKGMVIDGKIENSAIYPEAAASESSWTWCMGVWPWQRNEDALKEEK